MRPSLRLRREGDWNIGCREHKEVAEADASYDSLDAL